MDKRLGRDIGRAADLFRLKEPERAWRREGCK